MGILSQAIRIQQDGVRFYSDQAEKNANTALRDVFTLLAEDEKRHAMILQATREGSPYELRDDGIGEKVANLFESMESIKQGHSRPHRAGGRILRGLGDGEEGGLAIRTAADADR